MVRLSNAVVSFLNAVALLISLAAIGVAVWFHARPGSVCQKVIQEPLLITGLALFAVSLLGLIGSGFRVQVLMWIYLAVMFLLIVGLICFTAFTIVVTNKGVGQAISGRGYKEYRLGDYSNWLRKYVVNAKNWGKIKSCLADAGVCSGLSEDGESAERFYRRSLSPTQSGCCKPPTYCGFEFKNATFWTVPKAGRAAADSDCKTWNNNQAMLCYDCNSCKAGVLANIKKEWRLLTIINACILLFIILVYSIGCCALRNSRRASTAYQKHKPSSYP
ncbi:hypothetical protein NMG60_11005836 [Bertholletia excelsa]